MQPQWSPAGASWYIPSSIPLCAQYVCYFSHLLISLLLGLLHPTRYTSGEISQSYALEALQNSTSGWMVDSEPLAGSVVSHHLRQSLRVWLRWNSEGSVSSRWRNAMGVADVILHQKSLDQLSWGYDFLSQRTGPRWSDAHSAFSLGHQYGFRLDQDQDEELEEGEEGKNPWGGCGDAAHHSCWSSSFPLPNSFADSRISISQLQDLVLLYGLVSCYCTGWLAATGWGAIGGKQRVAQLMDCVSYPLYQIKTQSRMFLTNERMRNTPLTVLGKRGGNCICPEQR